MTDWRQVMKRETKASGYQHKHYSPGVRAATRTRRSSRITGKASMSSTTKNAMPASKKGNKRPRYMLAEKQKKSSAPQKSSAPAAAAAAAPKPAPKPAPKAKSKAKAKPRQAYVRHFLAIPARLVPNWVKAKPDMVVPKNGRYRYDIGRTLRDQKVSVAEWKEAWNLFKETIVNPQELLDMFVAIPGEFDVGYRGKFVDTVISAARQHLRRRQRQIEDADLVRSFQFNLHAQINDCFS